MGDLFNINLNSLKKPYRLEFKNTPSPIYLGRKKKLFFYFFLKREKEEGVYREALPGHGDLSTRRLPRPPSFSLRSGSRTDTAGHRHVDGSRRSGSRPHPAPTGRICKNL